MTARRDLSGQRFGRLTVVGPAPDANGRVRWSCRCTCGRRKAIRTSHLVDGRSTSCGCARIATLKAKFPRHRLNLTGKTFGDLTVLGRGKNVPTLSDSFPNGMTTHVCRCRCGRVVLVRTSGLTRAKNPTSHCGCRFLKPAVRLKDETPLAAAPAPRVEAEPPRAPAPPPASPARPRYLEAFEVVWNGSRPDKPLKTTSSAEAMRRFHDEHSAIGPVRRLSDEEDEPGVLFDFDPFV